MASNTSDSRHSDIDPRPTTEVWPTEDQPLFHVSINPAGKQTLLLLHGLTASYREWMDISPHLSTDFHLLIPDLPGHSRSRNAQLSTIPQAAELLSILITRNAHGGVCHLVGFSAGGYAALALAHQYPALIRSVFVSGVYDMGQSHWAPLVKFAPYIQVPLTKLQGSLPRSVLNYVLGKMGLKLPDGALKDAMDNNSTTLIKQGFASIMEFGKGYPVPARTCVIAGGKQDDVPGTTALGELLRTSGGNESSRAFVLKDARHAWGLQNPSLFAQAVKCWVGGSDMPIEFQNL